MERNRGDKEDSTWEKKRCSDDIESRLPLLIGIQIPRGKKQNRREKRKGRKRHEGITLILFAQLIYSVYYAD